MAILPPGGSVAAAEPARRRSPLPGLALCIAVVLAFVAVVVALNAGTYGASGFVSRYLDALARRDLAVALSTPGVELPVGASSAALTRQGLGELGSHRIVREEDGGDGRRVVTAEYRLGSRTSTTDFLVEPGPRIALLFSGWRFAQSPATTLDVTALHSSTFRINGVSVDAADRQPGVGAVSLAVLAPGTFTLDEESRYLTADRVRVDVTSAVPSAGTVDVRASTAFDEAVDDEVRSFLDQCTTQQVLAPAGCPFRAEVSDRIMEAPVWSIASYPAIDIQPGTTESGDFAWVSAAGGTAHIVVDVVSLFDGSRSTLDEDIPFTAVYRVTIRDDGGLDIRAG